LGCSFRRDEALTLVIVVETMATRRMRTTIVVIEEKEDWEFMVIMEKKK